MGKFRQFWKYAFVMGSASGADPTEDSEGFKKLIEMETCKIVNVFMNY